MIPISDFLRLRDNLPVVDVRSESEFKAGHIPGAFNIPVLNDKERVIVGTTFKYDGQSRAIELGQELVEPRLQGMMSMTQQLAAGREILVHCWRGGLRSAKFCDFATKAGVRSRSLVGGYKAYRHRAFELFKTPLKLRSITGYTGSGKSEILRALGSMGEQIIDLEGLAKHKGSVFGGLLMPDQPTTEQFLNDLFEVMLKLDPARRVWVEDESLSIGKIFLPLDFWGQMQRSSLVQINVDRYIRLERLVNEYGDADRSEFIEIMGKIVKRLGGQHYQQAKIKLLEGDMAATIDILLTYYDRAYFSSTRGRVAKIDLALDWDGKGVHEFASRMVMEMGQ